MKNIALTTTFLLLAPNAFAQEAKAPAQPTAKAPVAPAAKATSKPVAKKAVNRQLIAQLNDNLIKVGESIDLTKEKMRTARDIQFLPELYLSLAELLVEKSRIKYAIKLEEAAGRPMTELDFTPERTIKLEAIEQLTAIENRYPNYVGLDRVIFAIAHEYREMNEGDNALKAFKRLVDKFPQSSYWAEAQYGIGNIYYDKKDFEFALEQYKKILSRESDFKVMSMMAHYKIGLCYMQMDKSLLSLKSFENVLTSDVEVDSEKLPQDFKRKDVREEALVASVKPLSDLEPEELRQNPKYQFPVDYYKNLAPNRASYRSLLLRLGTRMKIKKRENEAAKAWYALLEIAVDPTQGRDALEKFFYSMKSMNRKDYPETAAHVTAKLLWEIKQEKKSDFMRYEPVLRDIATSSHHSALQTKRPDDLNAATEAYRDYLWIYPNTKYMFDIKLNMAELAFHAGRNIEAGLGYAELAKVTKDSKKQKGFYSSAFESFNRAFKDVDKISLLEKTQGRTSYLNLAQLFEKQYPTDAALPSVVYNVAKSLYDSQEYESAASWLMKYAQRYPNGKDTSAAAVLLLDCYYVRDDLKSLVAKGNQLLKLPLQANLKKEIQTIMQESQFKRVRSVAGEFATKSYADQFLKFAQQAGKSSLGETALLEAFVSLKSAQDPSALKIGEQYIGQFGSNPKAKDVLNNMIQLALASANFSKAATYLAAYSQKYPNDESSSKFAMTSAQFHEALGSVDQAAEVYIAMGNPARAADAYFKVKKWSELQKVAQNVTGVKGYYYQGLSQYRLGQKDSAYRLLERVFNTGSSDPAEKAYVAHAGYLLSLKSLKEYLGTAAGGIKAVADIKKKATALAETDKVLWKTIETGVGKWVIASLQMQAVMYQNFAQYLKRGPAPAPLTPQQYQQMSAPQIDNYMKSAKENFFKCAKTAEESEVMSSFVENCRQQKMALVNEAADEEIALRAPAAKPNVPEEFRAKLLKESSNVDLLDRLGQYYLKSGDYAQSSVIYSRILEIDPQNANAYAQQGVLSLYGNAWDQSSIYFQEALKRDPQNSTAHLGLSGLYRKFGYKNKAASALNQSRAGGKPRGIIHPLMRQ